MEGGALLSHFAALCVLDLNRYPFSAGLTERFWPNPCSNLRPSGEFLHHNLITNTTRPRRSSEKGTLEKTYNILHYNPVFPLNPYLNTYHQKLIYISVIYVYQYIYY